MNSRFSSSTRHTQTLQVAAASDVEELQLLKYNKSQINITRLLFLALVCLSVWSGVTTVTRNHNSFNIT